MKLMHARKTIANHVCRCTILSGLASLLCVVGAHAQRPRPFTVSGSVMDARGQPLAGAEIMLNADFVYGRASVTSGPDGRFLLTDLIRATYRIQAWHKAAYAGRTICHRLATLRPTDDNSFPVSEGAERHFRWQMSGRIGNSDAFLGASVRVWAADELPLDSGAELEFTLVPTSTLLDGSAASTLVRRAPLVTPASEIGLDDVPIATYRIRAVLVTRVGQRTALQLKDIGAERFASEIDVVWRTENRCGFGTDNGTTAPFTVQLRVP